LPAAVRGSSGAASHGRALWLDGLIDVAPRPELTIMPTARLRGRHDVNVHRSAIESVELRMIDGLPVTSTARTVLDVAHLVSPTRLDSLIDRAVDMGLTDHDQLAAAFLRRASRGRLGIARARAVLDRIDPALAPGESDLETLMLDVVQGHGL
jgi:hypothetical protein